MEQWKDTSDRLKVAIASGLAGAALISIGYHMNSRDAVAASSPSEQTSTPTTLLPLLDAHIPPKPDIADQLQRDWGKVIESREGNIDIAIYDHQSGRVIHYAKGGQSFNTASIVKLSVLEELLRQNQEQGQTLTSDQLREATAMIECSDNGATYDLWNRLGGENGMNRFYKLIGALATTAGANGYFGNTMTTAVDQLAVVNAMAYPNQLLTENSRATAIDLTSHVDSEQRWGISGGLPADVTFEVKNGWLDGTNPDRPNLWTINSEGHIHKTQTEHPDATPDYTIVVLTDQNPSEQYGRETIELLSAATWTDVAGQTA